MGSRTTRPMGTRSMAEFFSAYINSSSGVSLYGTITIEDGAGDQRIFNRSRKDYEYKQQGCTPLLLTGPPGYVSGFDSVGVYVDLKDGDSEEEIKGVFSFDSLNWLQEHLVDQPSCEVFDGKYGSSLKLYYTVFSHAVVAYVEVMLTRTPHDVPTVNVQGQITAQNSYTVQNNDSEEYTTVLKDQCSLPVVVSPGEMIRLTRRAVVVPWEYNLMVSAILFDDFGNQIVCGGACFRTKMSGNAVETISGTHGEIRVKISWKDI